MTGRHPHQPDGQSGKTGIRHMAIKPRERQQKKSHKGTPVRRREGSRRQEPLRPVRIWYDRAPLDGKNRARCVLEGLLLALAVNGLFYRRWIAFILLVPAAMCVVRFRVRDLREKRKKALLSDFREMLDSLAVSTRAGLSVENAFREAERNVLDVHGGPCDMADELHYINAQVRLNVPVEELMTDLGMRSNLEDVMNFASVLTSAKRHGGAMADLVASSARALSAKIDVEQSIEASIAAKKYEISILAAMPAVMILYLNLTSPGFLSVLYDSSFGACVMTACLALYVAAVVWSLRIVKIDV